MIHDHKVTDPIGAVQRLRVLVSAGAGGAGRIISEMFAARGASELACDIAADACEQLRAAQPDVCVVSGDISSEQTVDSVVAEAERRFGGVDVLVNNVGAAGPTAPKPFIPRSLTFEIPGRIRPDGTEFAPLDEAPRPP